MRFPQSAMPSTGTIKEHWQKCRKTVSVLDKNRARKEKSTHPGKTSCYWYSTLKVVGSLATQYGMSAVTIQADTKLSKVPPYNKRL